MRDLCLHKCELLCCYMLAMQQCALHTSEKKYFIEYAHGYVYITKRRYVICGCFLLWERLVDHSTSFVEASQKDEARRAEQ